MAAPTFKPKTVYVAYIGATPEKVWEALTSPAFTRQWFSGLSAEIEGRAGGSFILRNAEGGVHIRGSVVEWEPPKRFSCTWTVEAFPAMRELPECLVTYEIEPAGEAVRLTMTEAHSWDMPDAMLSGGRMGWPAFMSSLKSLLETGKALSIKMEPPKEMMAALPEVLAAKPWLKQRSG
ncbi:MAG TPA: SRPBCC family protein [Pseudolabrys sp.]|nr:SRPBCC family protein [Pseudolabrys sp.]